MQLLKFLFVFISLIPDLTHGFGTVCICVERLPGDGVWRRDTGHRYSR